jgi:hypothetical protein
MNLPPAFWDNSSKVWVTQHALIDVTDRKTSPNLL